MNSDNLGVGSLPVLMKLGRDLRPCYQDMLEADLPPELSSLAEKLVGYTDLREVQDGAEQG